MSDYNLIGVNSSDPSQLLIDEGRRIGVPSITETPQDAFMMRQALIQSQYQASVGVQGHQHFSERAALAMQKFPGAQISEICAESWPGQSAEEHAAGAYKDWRQSPGHWHECNRKHSVYGYAMAQGANGIWYACGQFADQDAEEASTPDTNNLGGLFKRLLALFRNQK